MKHFKVLFLAAVSLIVFNAGALAVAQQPSVDDSTVQQRLDDQGLDEAPAPIQVQERTWSGEKPSSGWVDDNGNPMSDEEYAEWRENQKGVFKKYPWLLPAILVGLAGVVAAGLKLKKKK